MNIEYLIQMANSIAEFFQTQPNPTAAQQEFAQHLRKFWDPRMRAALLTHLDKRAGADLLPFVSQALQAHRQVLLPT